MATATRNTVPVEDRRTGSPAEQLRRDLVRFRETGRDFDSAWEIAFDRIKWPHDTLSRRMWKANLQGQRPHWRTAYEREQANRAVAATARLAAA